MGGLGGFAVRQALEPQQVDGLFAGTGVAVEAALFG